MSEPEQQDEPVSFETLLLSPPNSKWTRVEATLTGRRERGEHGGFFFDLQQTEIKILCPEETCNGQRFFEPHGQTTLSDNDTSVQVKTLAYMCRNCRKSVKLFALGFVMNKPPAVLTTGGGSPGARPLALPTWRAVKVGEVPEFTIPTPTKLTTLLGAHRQLFLKGRQCEIHNQGIGAFAYYRRIVELCKNELLNSIIAIARNEGGGDPLIADLEAAKGETQFAKAVASIKHALPNSLFLDGHNPLTLLHSCLSKGIHELSDDECLTRATAVREVLANLAVRVAELKKDQSALRDALSKIQR
jgi:hypothetical protein